MRIDKNSRGTIAIVYLVSIAVVLSLFLTHCTLWVTIPLTAAFVWLCGWQTLFFRVPVRSRFGNDSEVSSVADGKVVIIEKTFESEFLKRECIQVSVYMDFWDVHANFWPLTGEVTYYKYHPGKHFLAFQPKASEENEHSSVCVRNNKGRDLFFKQLAGTFARRIVCYAKSGMETEAGAQCGIIKFGSRIDMFLPLDAEIKVKLGEQVRACETIIAKI